jgi:uncharacterized protein involved in exopolysaccharide biosynthesis
MLGDVDQEIQKKKNKNNLTDIKADVTYYFQVNAKLQLELTTAETQLKMVDIIYDFVKSENNKYSLIPFSTTTLDPSIADVISKYNETLLTRNDWRDNSPIVTSAIQSMDKQIEAQRENLLQSLENIKKGMQITFADLKGKEQELNSRIGNIPSAEHQYVDLKREQEIQQTVYLFLIEKREETLLKAVSLMPKLKVINEPYIVNTPASPNLKKLVILVLFFGGFLFPLTAIYAIPVIRNYFRNRRK